MIKPLFNVDHIRDPFWRGFAEVWTHWLWIAPLLACILLFLK